MGTGTEIPVQKYNWGGKATGDEQDLRPAHHDELASRVRKNERTNHPTVSLHILTLSAPFRSMFIPFSNRID